MASEREPKKIATKKAKVKKEPLPKSSIYNDSRWTKHPNFPTEDLMKVLIRNPKEVYVFWKWNPKTVESYANQTESKPMEGLRFRLRVQYKNLLGSEREVWYDLAPFTESYYVQFIFPVAEVEAAIFLCGPTKEQLCLHSKAGDLPPVNESFRLDKEWIHPRWIEQGLVAESSSGNYYFKEGKPGEFYVNPRGVYDSPSSHYHLEKERL
ncbi:hypothetical protein P3G55_04745 [Leptospira sp. 96542]|nr:hypothetical protein [Leptospira sp. 96542]